jgi:hypothetical protein
MAAPDIPAIAGAHVFIVSLLLLASLLVFGVGAAVGIPSCSRRPCCLLTSLLLQASFMLLASPLLEASALMLTSLLYRGLCCCLRSDVEDTLLFLSILPVFYVLAAVGVPVQ